MTPKRGEKNGNKKASTPVTALPEPQAQPQPLQAVLRALVRSQTRALIFEHIAEVVATMFRGNDASPPTKLLALPNGLRCRAEIGDVVEIEGELQRLAYAARVTMNALNRADVIVDPVAPQCDVVASSPLPHSPVDEGVAENPACRPVAPPAGKGETVKRGR